MSRNQQIMPHISDLEDTATVVIRLASTGAANTYNIPWVKSGLPITSQGPVPSPRRGNGRIFLPSDTPGAGAAAGAGGTGSLFQFADVAAAGPAEPRRSGCGYGHEPTAPALTAALAGRRR